MSTITVETDDGPVTYCDWRVTIDGCLHAGTFQTLTTVWCAVAFFNMLCASAILVIRLGFRKTGLIKKGFLRGQEGMDLFLAITFGISACYGLVLLYAPNVTAVIPEILFMLPPQLALTSAVQYMTSMVTAVPAQYMDSAWHLHRVRLPSRRFVVTLFYVYLVLVPLLCIPYGVAGRYKDQNNPLAPLVSQVALNISAVACILCGALLAYVGVRFVRVMEANLALMSMAQTGSSASQHSDGKKSRQQSMFIRTYYKVRRTIWMSVGQCLFLAVIYLIIANHPHFYTSASSLPICVLLFMCTHFGVALLLLQTLILDIKIQLGLQSTDYGWDLSSSSKPSSPALTGRVQSLTTLHNKSEHEAEGHVELDATKIIEELRESKPPGPPVAPADIV